MKTILVFILFTLGLVQGEARPINDLSEGIPLQIRRVKVMPRQTPILSLGGKEELSWKEINRVFDDVSGMVERIPVNQTADSWTDLINIQYLKAPLGEKLTVDEAINRLRIGLLLSHYDESKILWKVIEKKERSFIYEWAILAPYKGIEPQHEIAKGIVTSDGFYRVGYIKKPGQITAEEKEKWLDHFKKDTFMMDFNKAIKSNGLSLADKKHSLLYLGDSFKNWELYSTEATVNGCLISEYIQPLGLSGGVVSENLAIFSLPNAYDASIDEFYEKEKEHFPVENRRSVEFKLLTRSPKEIIYTFKFPGQGTHIYGIARSIITDQGWYSFRCKKGGDEPMSDADRIQWEGKALKQLNNIKVRL